MNDLDNIKEAFVAKLAQLVGYDLQIPGWAADVLGTWVTTAYELGAKRGVKVRIGDVHSRINHRVLVPGRTWKVTSDRAARRAAAEVFKALKERADIRKADLVEYEAKEAIAAAVRARIEAATQALRQHGIDVRAISPEKIDAVEALLAR